MFTQNEQFALQVLVDGSPLQEYPWQGERFIEGIIGRNFTLRLSKTPLYRRALAIVSVDGLSIMDGKLAKTDGNGYIIDSGEKYIDIPGWRLSDKEVAAFFFASLPEAYASQMGKPTNIGVIGAKFFYEQLPEPPPSTTMYSAAPELPGAPEQWKSRALPPPSTSPAPGGSPYGVPPSAPIPLAPGVGTGFGNRQAHSVHTVQFQRDQTTAQTLVLRYDTAENLQARGIVLPNRGDRVMQADPFPGDSGCTPPSGWKG